MIILIVILLLSTVSPVTVYAVDTPNYFARILNEDTYLYRTPNDISDTTNIFFTLPKTYFVKLIDSENSAFYKAQYLGISGYVKKDCVRAIIGTPIRPYLDNINFRIYAELSRDLRDEPNTAGGSAKQVAYIPLLNRNLTFYGTVHGEQLIDGRTDLWYYCKYTADKDYYGYVYSDFCDEMSEMAPNTEEVEYIASPLFTAPPQKQTTIPIEKKTTGIIVGVLCVPAILFLFMIIKGSASRSIDRSSRKEIKDY